MIEDLRIEMDFRLKEVIVCYFRQKSASQ